MELKQVFDERSFVVVGDTLNEEKFAYKIKHAMLDKGYKVQCVGKELTSINDVMSEIDIIDLCIRSDKGLALMQECRKPCKGVVIQPGAGSEELEQYLREKNIPYSNGCLLKGLSLYRT